MEKEKKLELDKKKEKENENEKEVFWPTKVQILKKYGCRSTVGKNDTSNDTSIKVTIILKSKEPPLDSLTD